MTIERTVEVDPERGLSASEVAQRFADGRSNAVLDRNSRSLGDIVRANTFTYFNALIGTLWVLMLLSAPLIDSLFGLVIVVNTGILAAQHCDHAAARRCCCRVPPSCRGLFPPAVRTLW